MKNTQRNQAIKRFYLSGKYTTEEIAKWYNISTRQLQRIASKEGYIRTQADANKIAAPLKNYRTIPVELRVKRKQLSSKLRYQVISSNPFCVACGERPEGGARLEVDHIDHDATNNALANLQVLCARCNTGKAHLYRYN